MDKQTLKNLAGTMSVNSGRVRILPDGNIAIAGLTLVHHAPEGRIGGWIINPEEFVLDSGPFAYEQLSFVEPEVVLLTEDTGETVEITAGPIDIPARGRKSRG